MCVMLFIVIGALLRWSGIKPIISPRSVCIVLWCGWMYHSVFNHSTLGGHLGCFQFEAITNKSAMNGQEYISV